MITILMSTYNGAAYLSEQIDSIIAQTYSDWQLVVRDDGSADDTVALVRSYAAKDERIRLVSDGQNRGAMRSFEYLLSEYGAEGYIAFADQDDVWLPDKLQVSLQRMQEAEEQYGAETPVVVHTDLIITDARMHRIADSFWKYSYIKPRILNERAEYLSICNSVTGCTVLLNQAAREAALPFGVKALMHDSAVAVAVKRCGGRVVPVEKPTVYYRQHGDNTLGAVKYHLFRSTAVRYREAKEHYYAYHPEIFANKWIFLYWKLRCFWAEHTKR